MQSVEMLEQRIKALEVGSQYEATKQAVQAVEKQHLETLRNIKAAMLNEQAGASSSKELERIKKENEELKRKNSKLEYRVNHMASAMEELYERSKQSRA